jgi:transposase
MSPAGGRLCENSKSSFEILYIIKKSITFVIINQNDMSFITTIPRTQLMLPSSIDDYVSSDNIVRFIDAFVDKVFGAKPVLLSQKGKSEEGRPSYPPNCLCKLLIYGYLNSVSSSRKLENDTKRNLEAIWLLNNLRPDHWTISDFRKENKELIKSITIDFRKFLKDSGYIKGKSISTDGTKIKAYASRDTLSLKRIDKKLEQAEKEIDRYFSQLNENDTIENEQEEMLAASTELKNRIAYLQQRVEELQTQKQLLETLGVESLVPADPESKVMKSKDGFMPSYNIQTTTDNDSHFLTSCEVTDYPNDFHSLKENIDTVKEQLDLVPKTCIADGGYANEEDIQLLEKQAIECIVSFPDEPESKKIQRDNGITFTYDEKADCFKCSQGKTQVLIEKNHRKRTHIYNKYQCRDCSECPVRQYCTTSEKGRIIYRRLNGEWLDNYKKKLKTGRFKEALKTRKCVAEHPFGTMKYYMGQIPILLRGKQKVQVEMDLYSTAYNLTRLKNVETVPVLLEKLAKWDPVSGFFVYFIFLLLLHSKKRIYSPIFYSKIM